MKKITIAVVLLVIMFSSCNLSDHDVDLGGGYTYYSEGFSDKIIFHESNSIRIPRSIIGYQFDPSFILVAQVDISRMEKLIDEDEQVINPRKISFWIIEIKRDKLHGPLTLDRYLSKRNELNIPTELKLEITL